MTPTTCPKCGAEEGGVHIIAGGFASLWTCGSGEDFQSYKCRIRQLEAENARLQDALRSLACWLGVGGYNSPTVEADVFERKIRDGVDLVVGPLQEEVARLRTLNEELANRVHAQSELLSKRAEKGVS